MDVEYITKVVIPEKLKEIEQKNNIRIIHCVESGSRAWGFASPDSDFDVRFIYVRPKNDYLKLNKTTDIINWQLDDVFDINGWDLQKALILLQKSNPTLFEWNGSHIVYKTTPEWKVVSDMVNDCFKQKCGLYHYLNTAKSNYREYLKGEVVRYKKYFYVLRPILACKWIIEKQCPPPVPFDELAEACLDGYIRPEVEKLLQLKRTTPELGEGKRIDALNEYLDKSILQISKIIDSYPNDEYCRWDDLNKVFLNILDM